MGASARSGRSPIGRPAGFPNRYEVFHSNRDLVLTSARLRRECEAAGRTLDTGDAWIAATAVLLDCPLASNDRGFAGVPGLELLRVGRGTG